MKHLIVKKTLFTLAISLTATTGFAQWNQSGNNIYTTNNVGIGTTSPQYKLDVNGDIRANILYLKTLNPGAPWVHSKIYYPGHSLVIGSPEGNYSYNNLTLRPGGAPQGRLHSSLYMDIALKVGEYKRKVQIHTEGDSFFNGGNVGIGTEKPEYKLDVNGDIRVNILYLKTLNPGAPWVHSKIYYPGHSLIIGSPEGNYSYNNLTLRPGGAPQGRLHSSLYMDIALKVGEYKRKVQIHTEGDSFFNGGNVGIGTEKPKNLLDVNGTIRAKEVKIELENWSDFVFDKDYKLLSLNEVEAHINEHKHLPNIPSEKQVREDGVNLAEMQAKLLQKIEELTLYVIDLKKENQEIKKQLSNIKNK